MSDVPELVDAMLDELTPEYGRKQLTHEAWIALQRYSWPGNVRELRHAVARAVTLGGDTLGPHDFFPEGLGLRRLAELAGDIDESDPLLAPYEAMMRARWSRRSRSTDRSARRRRRSACRSRRSPTARGSTGS